MFKRNKLYTTGERPSLIKWEFFRHENIRGFYFTSFWSHLKSYSGHTSYNIFNCLLSDSINLKKLVCVLCAFIKKTFWKRKFINSSPYNIFSCFTWNEKNILREAHAHFRRFTRKYRLRLVTYTCVLNDFVVKSLKQNYRSRRRYSLHAWYVVAHGIVN